MKSRWPRVCLCVVAGSFLLGAGLMVPAHLRALDAGVVLSAGRQGESVLERGRSLLAAGRFGSAKLLVEAAWLAQMPGWDRLGADVTNRVGQNPAGLFWGNDARAKSFFNSTPQDEPFAAFLVRRENRDAALARLDQSLAPAVPELLRCRGLSRLALFPPSTSPAGQAFDAVLAEGGLLLDGSHLTPALAAQIRAQAEQANSGNGSQPLEQTLMDFASLGERLNWDQLTAFVADIPDAAMLHLLAAQFSLAGDRAPLLFAAVQLSGDSPAVGRYLAKYPQTGLQDLSAGLWYGASGERQLAQSGQRFYASRALGVLAAREPFGRVYYFAAARALHHPWLALAGKWFSILGAGMLFALAFHLALPPVSDLEMPLQVRGFHLLRGLLFSLGFLLVVLLLSEPFLAQESQKGAFSLRLHLPLAGGSVAAGVAGIKQTVMNPTILLTLLVFFVLQALIYISCLVKLAEIRRQQIPPRMKLKLLENEDHLFDAGLYLGFVGTIISLILASVGLVSFSLMAAYSSTSFGIIFVVIFKIFHLRPARRKLLLEAELAAATAPPAMAPAAAQPVLTP